MEKDKIKIQANRRKELDKIKREFNPLNQEVKNLI